MKVNFINLNEKELGFVKSIFENVFKETILVLNTTEELEVNVFFVNKCVMKKINKSLRGISKSTDVLSVPTLPLKPSQTKKLNEIINKDALKHDVLLETGNIYLGDVILCPRIIKKHAKEYGHNNEREFAYVFVHSLLHLFGFNHKTETNKKSMRTAEEKVLKKLNITRE